MTKKILLKDLDDGSSFKYEGKFYKKVKALNNLHNKPYEYAKTVYWCQSEEGKDIPFDETVEVEKL